MAYFSDLSSKKALESNQVMSYEDIVTKYGTSGTQYEKAMKIYIPTVMCEKIDYFLTSLHFVQDFYDGKIKNPEGNIRNRDLWVNGNAVLYDIAEFTSQVGSNNYIALTHLADVVVQTNDSISNGGLSASERNMMKLLLDGWSNASHFSYPLTKCIHS